eukprot:875837-Pleurochrysis_carterae.AAC.1
MHTLVVWDTTASSDFNCKNVTLIMQSVSRYFDFMHTLVVWDTIASSDCITRYCKNAFLSHVLRIVATEVLRAAASAR